MTEVTEGGMISDPGGRAEEEEEDSYAYAEEAEPEYSTGGRAILPGWVRNC